MINRVRQINLTIALGQLFCYTAPESMLLLLGINQGRNDEADPDGDQREGHDDYVFHGGGQQEGVLGFGMNKGKQPHESLGCQAARHHGDASHHGEHRAKGSL